jgi:hypothetical protein
VGIPGRVYVLFLDGGGYIRGLDRCLLLTRGPDKVASRILGSIIGDENSDLIIGLFVTLFNGISTFESQGVPDLHYLITHCHCEVALV